MLFTVSHFPDGHPSLKIKKIILINFIFLANVFISFDEFWMKVAEIVFCVCGWTLEIYLLWKIEGRAYKNKLCHLHTVPFSSSYFLTQAFKYFAGAFLILFYEIGWMGGDVVYERKLIGSAPDPTIEGKNFTCVSHRNIFINRWLSRRRFELVSSTGIKAL